MPQEPGQEVALLKTVGRASVEDLAQGSEIIGLVYGKITEPLRGGETLGAGGKGRSPEVSGFCRQCCRMGRGRLRSGVHSPAGE